MCYDGLKSSWSESDKPPISKAQKVGPKKHALIQPNPFQLPKENQALLGPRFFHWLSHQAPFRPGYFTYGTINIAVAIPS